MTCFDIYLAALSLIGEAEDTASMADYQKRAVRLFAYINASLYMLHIKIGGEDIKPEDLYISSLDQKFMLDECLVGAAALELASLLILDKLPSVSENLKARAEAEKAMAAANATSIAPTREVYGL